MRKSAKSSSPIWLLGLAGQPAKRIRLAAGEDLDVRRFDVRDTPSQTDYDRADPLVVFLDVPAWRSLQAAPPAWFKTARKVLVASDGDLPGHDEVLAGGFLACLAPPLAKARIVAAIKAARDTAGVFEDIAKLLGEAQRERDHMAQENGRLAFFQHMLARAMSTLDLAQILACLREDLGLAFPVSEVLGVFWGLSAESEIFLPDGLSVQAKAARTDYLLDLASRLRGAPPSSYRTHPVPGGDESAPAEPGRALLVPLRVEDKPFGCLSVLIHRDLAKHEQETAREALNQLAPCVKHSLDYLLLKRRADRDGLTGLYNRRSFDARLDQELKRHIRHKEGFVLLMADLDHFKAVNDTHGHLAGDAALKHAAHALESGLRSSDFLARYGGEEFAVILPHTGQSQAWMLAERLRRRVSSITLRYAGRMIPLTISIGMTGFAPGQAATPASLVAQADQALYAAKLAGRNRVSIAASREDAREAAQAGSLMAG
ncbi:sensor domain-containing diguanylate cyclase [Fundidesulfovibrio terrae]|uniref:sensor domain-containing diguanylate cyclase n=1 Tax=Fundidesulfovibrio terrae TaxID=2922866 RepID=UPI001FAF54E3|nr:GGDEF domain-containing protein [Fundidesulfovibrio terrae]